MNPACMSDIVAVYKQAYLGVHWIIRHVWYNGTSVQVAPDLQPPFFHLHSTSKMLIAVDVDQKAWPIVRYHANRHGL